MSVDNSQLYYVLQICQLWTRQCFWNYLDWPEICHYVTICILLGVDYQVYMCVAILKHMQRDILYHQQQQDLVIFLRVSCLPTSKSEKFVIQFL